MAAVAQPLWCHSRTTTWPWTTSTCAAQSTHSLQGRMTWLCAPYSTMTRSPHPGLQWEGLCVKSGSSGAHSTTASATEATAHEPVEAGEEPLLPVVRRARGAAPAVDAVA